MNPTLSARAVAVLAVSIAMLSAPTSSAFALAEAGPELQYSLAAEASTARDYAGMIRLLRESAERGYVPAQELLGVALLNGPVLYGKAVPRDLCGALKWLSLAAAQGSAVGKLHVTMLHRARRETVRACP